MVSLSSCLLSFSWVLLRVFCLCLGWAFGSFLGSPAVLEYSPHMLQTCTSSSIRFLKMEDKRLTKSECLQNISMCVAELVINTKKIAINGFRINHKGDKTVRVRSWRKIKTLAENVVNSVAISSLPTCCFVIQLVVTPSWYSAGTCSIPLEAWFFLAIFSSAIT